MTTEPAGPPALLTIAIDLVDTPELRAEATPGGHGEPPMRTIDLIAEQLRTLLHDAGVEGLYDVRVFHSL
jgi:hypothetical protein